MISHGGEQSPINWLFVTFRFFVKDALVNFPFEAQFSP